jgi:hypothetical protein
MPGADVAFTGAGVLGALMATARANLAVAEARSPY